MIKSTMGNTEKTRDFDTVCNASLSGDMCSAFEQLQLRSDGGMLPFPPTYNHLLPIAEENQDSGLGCEIMDDSTTEASLLDLDLCYGSLQRNDLTSVNSEDLTNRLFGGDEDGDTLLHISILDGNEAIVFHIIQKAPDFTFLSVVNDKNQTPLHFAVLTRQPRIVRRLVCAGAAVDEQDATGNTPLHVACALGYPEIAHELLKPVGYEETLVNKYQVPFQRIPQNMAIRNFDGFSCLHMAIVNNHLDIVRLLVERELDLNFGHGKSGRAALHLAVETGNLQMLALLICMSDVNVDEPDFDGLTSFQLAHGRGNEDAQRMLIANGATYRTLDFEEESDIDLSLTR